MIDESQDAVKILEISGEMEAFLYQSFINAQYYLDEPYRETLEESLQDSLVSIDNVKRRVRISLQGLDYSLKRIDRLLQTQQTVNPEVAESERVTVTQLRNRIMIFNSFLEQLLDYNTDDIEAAKELLNITIEPYYRSKLLPMVDQFRSQIRDNLDNEVVALNDRLNRYSNILLLATVLAFIFSLILAYLLYKSITTPIHELSIAAEEIGHGNLERRIEINSEDEIGKLGMSFNRMAENLNKITFSKEYVDDIIESMGDALIVTDQDAEITKINSATQSLLGYRNGELMGENLSLLFKDDEKESLAQVNRNAEVDSYETEFVQKSGSFLPVSLSKAVIHDNEGRAEGLVFVASDITERKKSEEMIRQSLKEKETMLAEIHHRVKNNLAVISGLLQMQEWKSEDQAAKGVLQDSQLRVKSIALVHEKLYQSENLSNISFHQYVEQLIEEINHTFENKATDIEFEIDVEPIELSVNKAIPCSLLLNELIVNIHKHAFKDRSKGKVQVIIEEQNGLVHLIVKDNGVGFDHNPTDDESLGMSLIETLVGQLGGELDAYNDNGATFDITFSLDDSNND